MKKNRKYIIHIIGVVLACLAIKLVGIILNFDPGGGLYVVCIVTSTLLFISSLKKQKTQL